MFSSQPINHPLTTITFSTEAFYRLILLAIILRIGLMPLFAHPDVLSEIRRIYFWDQSGIYFDDISRNITSLFQLLFFKVFSIFIENKEILFGHADMQNTSATPGAYFEFVSHTSIFRVLLIIKLPFLVADLVTAWALFQYCDRSTGGGRNAVIFWLYNPITIFAFYIFGRFESIPIMFFMLSLLAVKQRSLILAALFIGLSINSREMFIFLGPLFIALICSPSCRLYSLQVKIIAIAIVAFATAVAVQAFSLTGNETTYLGQQVVSIASEARVEHLFRFIVGSYIIFPMAYFFILVYAWSSNRSLQHKVPLLSALTFLSFFCFSMHAAHYVSWMMVSLCLFFAFEPKLLKPMIALCIAWFVYHLSISDLAFFTPWLASPMSINLAGIPNFILLYEQLDIAKKINLKTFQALSHTVFSGCIGYLSFQIINVYLRQTKK